MMRAKTKQILMQLNTAVLQDRTLTRWVLQEASEQKGLL